MKFTLEEQFIYQMAINMGHSEEEALKQVDNFIELSNDINWVKEEPLEALKKIKSLTKQLSDKNKEVEKLEAELMVIENQKDKEWGTKIKELRIKFTESHIEQRHKIYELEDKHSNEMLKFEQLQIKNEQLVNENKHMEELQRKYDFLLERIRDVHLKGKD